jgi:hypothetical protein
MSEENKESYLVTCKLLDPATCSSQVIVPITVTDQQALCFSRLCTSSILNKHCPYMFHASVPIDFPFE